jgi:hypothetical protein
MTTEATPEAAPSNGAPKISLADIEGEISHVYYMNGNQFAAHAQVVAHKDKNTHTLEMQAVTICLMLLKNGYVVVGQATPVSPENYDKAHGQKLAYDKCIAQIWPLMGYQLKEQLHTSA